MSDCLIYMTGKCTSRQ